MELIVALVCVEVVVVGAAEKSVPPQSAPKRVLPVLTAERIAAAFAEEDVIARPTVDHVVPVTGADHVVAGESVDRVIATKTSDDVVTVSAVDRVVALGTDDACRKTKACRNLGISGMGIRCDMDGHDQADENRSSDGLRAHHGDVLPN